MTIALFAPAFGPSSVGPQQASESRCCFVRRGDTSGVCCGLWVFILDSPEGKYHLGVCGHRLGHQRDREKRWCRQIFASGLLLDVLNGWGSGVH
jgi:hypothetical protein